MNILIISHMFPSEFRPNYGSFVLQQVKALQALGHQITVVCPLPWAPPLPFLPSRWVNFTKKLGERQIEGIRVLYKRFPIPPKIKEGIRGKLYFYIGYLFWKKIIKTHRFDIVHAQSILVNGDLGRLIKQKYNIPLILTVHGADLMIWSKQSAGNLKTIKMVTGASDSIGLVSNKLKTELEKIVGQSFISEKVQVIPNGIEVYDERPKLKERIKDKDSSVKIVTVCSLTRQKNLDVILQTLHKISGAKRKFTYDIIGEGWDRDYYEKQIRQYKLNSIVRLLGTLPHREVMRRLPRYDVFILLSRNEGLGIVYLEAMYSGLITIGSRGEGIDGIINNGENGFLVNPQDDAELVQLLSMLLPKIQEYDYLCKNAHATVWPKYSWQNNVLQYQKSYNRILMKQDEKN